MQEHAPNEQTVSTLLFECLKGGKVEKRVFRRFSKSRKASFSTIPYEKHLLALGRKPKVSAHHMRA